MFSILGSFGIDTLGIFGIETLGTFGILGIFGLGTEEQAENVSAVRTVAKNVDALRKEEICMRSGLSMVCSEEIVVNEWVELSPSLFRLQA